MSPNRAFSQTQKISGTPAKNNLLSEISEEENEAVSMTSDRGIKLNKMSG